MFNYILSFLLYYITLVIIEAFVSTAVLCGIVCTIALLACPQSFNRYISIQREFPGGSVVKNPPSNAGDAGVSGSMSGLGRSPGEGNENPLQYSCLGNPMDRGAWRATVRGVSKSQTWLSTHARICIETDRYITIYWKIFEIVLLLKVGKVLQCEWGLKKKKTSNTFCV